MQQSALKEKFKIKAKIERENEGLSTMTSSGIEGDVRKSLLDRPDAEKVFQPWWDSVEDYILNILTKICVQFNGTAKM